MLYVIGHKNPDTDSIVSAMVTADYLKKLGRKAKAFRVGKMNRETKLVLSKIKIKPPSFIKNLAKKKIFLVDHNKFEEAGFGIEKAEISGILDHHKLGGIRTKTPIYFRIEPLGSTAALIFKLFEEKNLPLNKNQAFLLLSGILSDTLKFTSPTCTGEDIKIGKVLAKISHQNPDDLAEEMFKAKSDVSGLSLEDLISSDYKEYRERKLIFGIGVQETIMPEIILLKKEKILNALGDFKQKRKIDLIFFGIVDILKKRTYLLIAGEKEKEVAERAFKKKEKENLILLPGIVSRKKQMVPAVLEAL